MFADARSFAGDVTLTADICVVGAGAAGITLALRLAAAGRSVLLAESGGFEPEETTQALYEGQAVGLPYPLADTRLRIFGGTTHHWSGSCRTLDAHDFEPRDWVPHSGWPFAASELEQFYERARASCDLPAIAPGVDDFQAAGGTPLGWRGPLHDMFWQLSPPTRFGPKYRAELGAARRGTVLLHANLTHLTASEGRIASALLKTLSGREIRVVAGRYVLACGGLENARLLLAMNDPPFPQGIGNSNGLVGRFFMEHPEAFLGTLAHVRPGPAAPELIVGAQPVGRIAAGVLPDIATQKAEGAAGWAYFPLVGVGNANATPVQPRPAELMQDAATRLAGRAPAGPRRFTNITVTLEQSPDPASRVTLAGSRDALGMPQLRLDWRLNDIDHHTLSAAARVLALEAGRQGFGRLWLRPAFRGLLTGSTESIRLHGLEAELGWGCHHMGTTRMHRDSRQGVVNADCRVHGIPNLYVAGSSVFPTAGVSNPTLTIVALAHRLADHLINP